MCTIDQRSMTLRLTDMPWDILYAIYDVVYVRSVMFRGTRAMDVTYLFIIYWLVCVMYFATVSWTIHDTFVDSRLPTYDGLRSREVDINTEDGFTASPSKQTNKQWLNTE